MEEDAESLPLELNVGKPSLAGLTPPFLYGSMILGPLAAEVVRGSRSMVDPTGFDPHGDLALC
jgi:hypothetical protein